MKKLVYLLLGFLLSSCAHVSSRGRQSEVTLDTLGHKFFTLSLKKDPFYATALHEPGYNHLVPDLSKEARRRELTELKHLRKALLVLDRATFNKAQNIRYDALLHHITSLIETHLCEFPLWQVDQLFGPQIALASLTLDQPFNSPKDLADYLERLHNARSFVRQYIANLQEGLSRGLSSPKVIIRAVVAQLKEQLAIKPEKSPYMITADRLPSSWTQAQKRLALKQIERELLKSMYPALEELHDFLAYKLLAKARDEIGLIALPFGKQCYERLIQGYIDLPLAPEEIHALGLAEIKIIKASMRKLVQKKSRFKDEIAYMKFLKDDPKHFVSSAAELIDFARVLIKRAEQALPSVFWTSPKTPIVVKPIEEYRHKNAPAAYYQEAPIDGSRPAYFYLNTYEATKRPLYNIPALTFHEAIPGHHWQVALAQENRQIRAFQRQLPQTAYVEGWALYAEILSRDLDLYDGLAEQFGSLIYELWRATRLVVDTGIHHYGWSRQDALKFMRENSALIEQEIVNEIDRYIVMPGQALAYKIGQRAISELRRKSEETLKQHFSLKDFHDQVLLSGPMPLGTLRRVILTWIDQQQQQWKIYDDN